MSFVPRAERAKARGDYTRAILVLVEGLKRYPGDPAAIDLLVDWYSVLHPLPGLEPDVVKAIQVQPNPDDLLSTLVDNLRGGNEYTLASALLQCGHAAGLTYIPVREDPAEDIPPFGPLEDEADVANPDTTSHGLPVIVPDGAIPHLEEEDGIIETPVKQSYQATQPPKVEETRRRIRVSKGLVVSAVALILFVCSGWFVFQKGRVHVAIHELDESLSVLDPLNPESTQESARKALKVGVGWSDVDERVEFIRVLNEPGTPVNLPDDTKTAWGAAAHAFSAFDTGDLELAIRFVTRLERLFPNELPTLWAELRLAEKRGMHEKWEDLATSLTEAYPDFPPGWMALMRVGAFRLDAKKVQKARLRLEALRPGHAYASVPKDLVEIPFTSPLPTRDRLDFEQTNDAFLQALTHMEDARLAMAEKQFTNAETDVDEALKAYPLLTSALVLKAVLRLRQFDLEGVELLRSVKGNVEIVAVQVLEAIGRPDLATQFASHDGMKSKQVAPKDPMEQAWEVGDHTRVIALYRAMDEVSRLQFASMAIHAYVALGQYDDAQAELSVVVSPIQDMEREGVRLVYLARRDPQSQEFRELFKRIEATEPTGLGRLVDLAYAAFWMGDVQKSEDLIGRVIELDPEHKRANWLLGVLFRARGEFRGSDQRFQKARGSELTTASLIELGQMYLSLGNFDEARKMFHKALIMERENLVALSGLGTAYSKLDPETSQRDLERIAQGYAGADVRVQRAETLKWLAICYGSRQGTSTSLTFLDEAEELVGKRADLVVERARYMEALGDFAAARGMYALALQSNSTLADAHLGLGRTALRAKDMRVARDHLEKYLELKPRGEERSWVESRLTSMK